MFLKREEKFDISVHTWSDSWSVISLLAVTTFQMEDEYLQLVKFGNYH